MHFKNVDKLRGFAALSVLIYHVVELTGWQAFPRSGPLAWFRSGWLGVDLFYVISGFVIAYSAIGLYESNPLDYQQQYWRRRLSRIFPLYLLTAVIFSIAVVPDLFHLKGPGLIFHVGTHLLFIHNLFPITTGSINGANWTIGVEMQFYLLVILLVPWLAKARPLRILVVFTLIAWLYRAVVVFLVARSGDAGFGGIANFKYFHYATQLPGSLDEFGFGIFLCRFLTAKDPGDLGLGPWARWLHNGWGVLIGAALAIAGMLSVFWTYDTYWDVPLMVIFFRTAIGLCGFLLVLAAVKLPFSFPKLVDRPLDYLGVISYGIYLWHLIVILSLKKFAPTPDYRFLLKTILCVLVLSAISWHFMEQPYMERFRKPKGTRPAVAGS
jgi:peptidoglycan/LPS O-acetylase OafA/YrhL